MRKSMIANEGGAEQKPVIAGDDELMSEQELEPIWGLIRRLKVLGGCTLAAGWVCALLLQLSGVQVPSWVLACVLVSSSAMLISGFSMDYALWRSARDRAIADALERERLAADKK